MGQELEKASDQISQFADSYTAIMVRRQGPFVGCMHCPARCLYRAEVDTLLSEQEEGWINDELSSKSYGSAEERYEAIVSAANDIAMEWLEKEREDDLYTLSGLSYCISLHAVNRANHSEYQQARISNNLRQYLPR